MSWKPNRSSGIAFDKATEREMKYRFELNNIMNDNASVEKISKSYYHLLKAIQDQRNYFGGNHSINYGILMPSTYLEQFKENKERCYKPLQQYII